MGKYNWNDDELMKEYNDYIDHGGNDTTGFGHYLANAISQRANEEGKSVEDLVKAFRRHRYHKNLDDSVDEMKAAKAICKVVSSQRTPLSHSGILIENVMREHGYKHLYVKGKQVPLSKARNFVVSYARALLFKYHLPTEPAEHPNIILE
jgi:hypothetical protein